MLASKFNSLTHNFFRAFYKIKVYIRIYTIRIRQGAGTVLLCASFTFFCHKFSQQQNEFIYFENHTVITKERSFILLYRETRESPLCWGRQPPMPLLLLLLLLMLLSFCVSVTYNKFYRTCLTKQTNVNDENL